MAKIDAAGHLVFATQLHDEGGTETRGTALAVGPDGDVYVTGLVEGQQIDARPTGEGGSLETAFVARLDAAGAPRWVRHLASTGHARGTAVALADDGRVYVAGRFEGALLVGEDTLRSSGGTDAFVAGLDPDGSPRWVTSFGGPGYDDARALAVGAGQVLAALVVDDVSAPGEPDAGQEPRTAPRRADVVSLEPSGGLRKVRSFESNADVAVNAFALDPRRGLLLAGQTDGPSRFEGAGLGEAGAFFGWSPIDPSGDAHPRAAPRASLAADGGRDDAMIVHRTQHRRPGFITLMLRFLGPDKAHAAFEIEGVVPPIKGTTDADGNLSVVLAASVRSPVVRFTKDPSNPTPVSIGKLYPIDVDAGVRDRLANLGFGDIPVGDRARLRAELTSFQQSHDLPTTGEADLATLAALRIAHGT